MKNTFLFAFSLLTLSVISAQTEITFYTSEGDFVLELEDELAPITAGNFLSLVNEEYYDGIIFHRIIDDFVIQGGDPTGTGAGGPGYTIEDEFSTELSNTLWTISMANSGPNSGGSQFFINMSNNSFLDFDEAPLTSMHPVFGRFTSGYMVIQTIENVPVDSSDRPLTDVVMDSLRVTQNGPLNILDFSDKGLNINVYPNPSQGSLFINSQDELSTELTLEVYSILGKKVLSYDLNSTLNLIDVSSLPAGHYSLRIYKGDAVFIKKLIID